MAFLSAGKCLCHVSDMHIAIKCMYFDGRIAVEILFSDLVWLLTLLKIKDELFALKMVTLFTVNLQQKTQ